MSVTKSNLTKRGKVTIVSTDHILVNRSPGVYQMDAYETLAEEFLLLDLDDDNEVERYFKKLRRAKL